MKKGLLICLLVIVSLFFITGCDKTNDKEESTKKDKNTHICKKTGIVGTSNNPEMKWLYDITNTAKVDDDGKLTYYSAVTEYTYNSEIDCDFWCDIKVNWNNDFNSNNYTGGHRNTECKCDKKTVIEEYIYDDIENLDDILRSDLSELNDDNTFDLNAWTTRYKKVNYECS